MKTRKERQEDWKATRDQLHVEGYVKEMQYRLSKLALENQELRGKMREKEKIIAFLEERLANTLMKYEEIGEEKSQQQEFYTKLLEGKDRRIRRLEIETVRLRSESNTSRKKNPPKEAWQTPVRSSPTRSSFGGKLSTNRKAPNSGWSPTHSLPSSSHSFSHEAELSSRPSFQPFQSREHITEREFSEAERRLHAAKLHTTFSTRR